MTTFAANNITTWFAGYDMTGDTNQTSLGIEWEALDDTRFGPTRTGRSRVAGLESATSAKTGLFEAGTALVDPTVFTALKAAGVQAVSQSVDANEGSPAYFYQSKDFSYQLFGEIGALAPFTLNSQSVRGNGQRGVGAVRGPILKTKASVAATGATGTANQMGAVAADQFLYAEFHAFAVGTTITAVLESAAANTFVGATTRMTFGPITAVGGTWGTRVAGAITDTWWRLRVSAITGTFTIACVAGIK